MLTLNLMNFAKIVSKWILSPTLPSTPPSSVKRFLRKFVSGEGYAFPLAGRNRFWWNYILVFLSSTSISWIWQNEAFVREIVAHLAINSSELRWMWGWHNRQRPGQGIPSCRKEPFLMKMYFGHFTIDSSPHTALLWSVVISQKSVIHPFWTG